MNKFLIAVAVLTSAAAPAYAQEAASPFAGAKIGAVVGYDKVRLEVEDEGGSKDGFLYGVTAGYDFDLGTAIVGVEGEFSDSTTKERQSDILVLGDSASLRAGRDLYIGARVGFPVNPVVMVYAKGGYTNAKVKATYNDGVDSFSGSDELDGWRIGGGAEFVSGNTFARVEYRYSEYDSNTDFGVAIEPSRHQVAVIGGFRF